MYGMRVFDLRFNTKCCSGSNSLICELRFGMGYLQWALSIV